MKMKIPRAPRRDEEVDIARTIYWFRWIGIRLKTQIPREIQRAIAPETLALDSHGEAIRNNKFLNYSRGKPVPRDVLVRQAEERVPRSGRALKHPLWSVLRARGSIKKSAHQWITQLDREVQTVVLNHFNEIVGGASRHTLGALERRAGLDSLAALTILLRLRHEEGQPEWAWLYARSIFRVLLMIGPELDEHGVAERVFQLFVERVFSPPILNGQRIDLTNYRYLEFCYDLADLTVHLQHKSEVVRDRKLPSFYAIQILDGRFKQALKEHFQFPVTHPG